MITSKDIKANFKKLGLAVAVDTSPSKQENRWMGARIRPINGGQWNAPLQFPASFTETMRRRALAIVYGEKFASEQSYGGNIGAHMFALCTTQWEQFFNAAVLPEYAL